MPPELMAVAAVSLASLGSQSETTAVADDADGADASSAAFHFEDRQNGSLSPKEYDLLRSRRAAPEKRRSSRPSTFWLFYGRQ